VYGREVPVTRFQQSYGRSYDYSGRTHEALPITGQMAVFLGYCQRTVDERLSGLLLNWYSDRHKHRIGAHRDSTQDLVPGSPIVTISVGEERVFRLRPWKGKGHRDFVADHGTVFSMPFETNLTWTHEVPHFARYQGRRISITARAFQD